MSITKLDELKRKQFSLTSLGDHYVGTGLYNYETSIRLPLDSSNHNSFPIEPEWFRQALKENWTMLRECIKRIAEADIASLRHDAIIEVGEFLKTVKIQTEEEKRCQTNM